VSKVKDGPQETGALSFGSFVAVKRSESLLKNNRSLRLVKIFNWRV
jgi:hypothetical protein